MIQIPATTLFLLLGALLFFPEPVVAQTQQHPSMLVRQSQYSQLQSQSNQEPWLGMKNEAINDCLNLQYTSATAACTGSPYNNAPFCMRNIMGACGLAYIVDPANRATYVDKFISVMPRWEDMIIIQSGADDGSRDVGLYTDATAAYMNTLLTLDVMRNDLALRSRPDDPDYPRPLLNEAEYAEFVLEQEYNHFYGITKPVYNFVARDGSTLAYHLPSIHPPAKEAALILWKIYKGEFAASDSDSRSLLHGGMLNNGGTRIEGFMIELSARINSSGVYTEGSSYAHAGWGLDRDERSHLVDVLEFTGKDQEFGVDFYTNPRFQAFYEWLYGYASTPFGMMTTYGDTYAFRRLIDDGHGSNTWSRSSHIGQAGKFSQNAGNYALWKSRGEPQQGRLLNYLLFTPGATIATPQSRIFENGGGFFFSQPVNDFSLYGTLWNTREPEDGSPVFHIRKDTNALYVAGYGAPLLMNGGFCGANTIAGPDFCHGSDGFGVFSGAYLGDRAVSNNRALVNYNLVVTGTGINSNPYTVPDDGITSKFGSGVLEGFTSNGLDYVAGSTRYRNGAISYDALSNGEHQRSFILVHPAGTANGYFISFDEFSSVTQGPVHLAFHPNAASRQAVTNLTEYNMPAQNRTYGDTGVGISLFFGTPPSTIQFERGVIATVSSIEGITPEYFFNTYPLEPDGTKRITTVMFPYDSTHQKGTMNRISGTGYTGATITQGSTVDTAASLTSSTTVPIGATSTQGQALFHRVVSGATRSYFVRKGMAFNNGAAQRQGFSSNDPISVYLNNGNGSIVSPGTTVRFYHPGITGVRVNGTQVSNTETGSGYRGITVPAGTHTISFVAPGITPEITPTGTTVSPTTTQPSPTPVPGDVNGDGNVTIADLSILLANFGGTGKTRGQGDVSGNDGNVTIADLSTLLSNFGG